jgi:diaminohydroxyphosphoribosylaminopyrimidine deaminase/5-amino-6-(5-phosphoribosylamino)uracil reductase
LENFNSLLINLNPAIAIFAAAITDVDKAHMRRALDLALTALGRTFPNPAVGCVIVKDGVIVGEGYHPKAGLPHAEVYALRAAGQAAAGATAYVTLEPCDHYGRTPPCSKALVAAGVARVVVGIGDPNPLVDGGGVATLKKAGIEVDVGCEEEMCYEINKDFMERMKVC